MQRSSLMTKQGSINSYDPNKKYTTVKRVTIGKVSGDDETKMRPNENFRKYFPELEIPEEKADTGRSSCLKAGEYMVVRQTVKDLKILNICASVIRKGKQYFALVGRVPVTTDQPFDL